MKVKKPYIIGIVALLCLVGTGCYAWMLYNRHCEQVSEWNEGAKAAFEEALWMEVNKRSEVPIFHYFKAGGGKITLQEDIPDTVYVTTSMGRKAFRIERFKHDNSLIKENEKKARVGVLLLEHPLLLEELKMNWDSLLIDRQIASQSKIRYVYTDLLERNDTVSVGENRDVDLSDSLAVKYLGFRCEHEFTAFVSYPHWLTFLSWVDVCVLLVPWGMLLLLHCLYPTLESFVQRKFVTKIEKEVIIEKKIHVADVAINKAKVYQLPDGSLFDSFASILSKGELSAPLPPQCAYLLIAFLQSKTHSLSMEEIDRLLWNGQGSKDTIHKAIHRLKAELKKVSSDVVIKNTKSGYELKMPISSKILDVEG